MTPIHSIEEILAYLRTQAELRAPENDLADVLHNAADYIFTQTTKIEPEWSERGY